MITRQIYIGGLFDMPLHVERLRPSHLISVIQPEFQPERPPEIAAEHHLRVAVHDISQPDGWGILVQAGHVRKLIEFASEWNPDQGSLLVHCYAGVSRSTAAALIVHVVQGGDPSSAARALRNAAPYSMPNARLIALADQRLDQAGELISSVQALGAPRAWLEEESLATMAV